MQPPTPIPFAFAGTLAPVDQGLEGQIAWGPSPPRYDPTVLAEQGGPFRWKPRPSDEALAGFLEGLRNRVGGIVQGVVFPQDFERYYEVRGVKPKQHVRPS